MKRIILFLLLLVFTSVLTYSQVKIGDNPSQIHGNSILELESTDKVLVISRVTNTQMTAIKPLRGALVYNIDEECVFMYSGTNWRSLCNSGTLSGTKVTTQPTVPTQNNAMGDFWINNARNNATSIYDGTNWVAIDNSPIKGNGAPDITKVPNPIAGDIYVNQKTGSIYAYDGSAWVSSGANIKANNGVLLNANNTLQLGGAIVKPTIIETDAINTFGIKGLQKGDVTKEDIVTVDKATGEFRKVSSYNLLKEEVIKRIADDNQLEFAQVDLKTKDKVNVYRNGVRIDFEIKGNLGDAKIILEPEAKCYAGDEIRIVQFY